jgi:hypothetical protein
MTKTILINDAKSNAAKSINKYLLEHFGQDSDYTILFNVFHQKLYYAHQTRRPQVVVWALSEYTQEIHDYIVEFSSVVKIILLIDTPIPQPDLIPFLNQSNVKIILDKKTKYEFNNTIAEYDRLYEDSLFFDQKKEKNNKTLILLSKNNTKNLEIIKLPTEIKEVYNMVAIGNPEYDSPINLGVFHYAELGDILSDFSTVIDLDSEYRLECQACNIPYVSLGDDFDISNISSFEPDVDNINECTYKHFVNNNIIPFIRK